VSVARTVSRRAQRKAVCAACVKGATAKSEADAKRERAMEEDEDGVKRLRHASQRAAVMEMRKLERGAAARAAAEQRLAAAVEQYAVKVAALNQLHRSMPSVLHGDADEYELRKHTGERHHRVKSTLFIDGRSTKAEAMVKRVNAVLKDAAQRFGSFKKWSAEMEAKWMDDHARRLPSPDAAGGLGGGPMATAVHSHGREEHRKCRSTVTRRQQRAALPHRQARVQHRRLLAGGLLHGAESITRASHTQLWRAVRLTSHLPSVDLA